VDGGPRRAGEAEGVQARVGAGAVPSRRTLFGMLGLGLAAWLAGCAAPAVPAGPGRGGGGTATASPSRVGAGSAAPSGRRIALTVDDGYAHDVVAGYVDFARRTGIHLTFSPNGTYASAWAPQAAVLRPLIDVGQVQIMNHTFSHPRLTQLSAGRVREELERNERWIVTTFGTSARPYWRPPYGAHDAAVDAIARDAGFPTAVMWTGSYGDSTLVTPEFLLDQARRYLTPGRIVLGHANHPTILGLFDQISDLLRERGLQPATLDEFFGTSRH
jgi:peptidoglycan-N-acetylglucosamine deacetylase